VSLRVKHLKSAFESDVSHDPRVLEMNGVVIQR
jgi:hypothetical protein